MKQLNLKYLWGICLILLSTLCLFSPLTTYAMSGSPSAEEKMPIENIVIKSNRDGTEHIFSVELATKPGQHEQGLMNRPFLAEDAGMLFVFDSIKRRSFWMENTLIPLDMLFISEDGTIHHIHHLAKPLDRTNITALAPSKAVLEINGGLADKLGIEAGDKIYHNAFKNMNLLADQ